MWLRLNMPIGELPSDNLALQWVHMVTRCTQSGQLSSLGLLLARQLPSLKDHPLVQKLRGHGPGVSGAQ